MNNFSVSEAGWEDIPQMLLLLREFAGADCLVNEEAVYRHAVQQILNQPGQKILLARQDGAVLGVCHFAFQWCLLGGGVTTSLVWMGVRESCRKQGVGCALLNALVAFCSAHGITQLEVLTRNEDVTWQRFLRRHGLRERGGVRYSLEITAAKKHLV